MARDEERPLIGYLSNVLREVREYQALMNSEQPEISGLFLQIENALDNQFVLTANEYGVKRWEKLLSIVPKMTDTLDDRKSAILSKLAEQLPYTYRMLERLLTGICGENGFSIHLEHARYRLWVELETKAISRFYDVDRMLRRVIPANLTVDLSVNYNRHYQLKAFTHEFFKDYTQWELRTYPFVFIFNLHQDLKSFTQDGLRRFRQHHLRNGGLD